MKEQVKNIISFIERAIDQYNENSITGSAKEYRQIEIGKPDPFDDVSLVAQNPICYYVPVGDGLYRPTMDKRIFCAEACRVIRENGDSTSISMNLNLLLKYGFQMYDICLAIKQDIKQVNLLRVMDNNQIQPFLKQAWRTCFGVTCDWYYDINNIEKKRIQYNPSQLPIDEHKPLEKPSDSIPAEEPKISEPSKLMPVDTNPNEAPMDPQIVDAIVLVKQVARKIWTDANQQENVPPLPPKPVNPEEWEFGKNGNPGHKIVAKLTDNDLSIYDYILVQEKLPGLGRAKIFLNIPMFSKWLKNTKHLHLEPFTVWKEFIGFIDALGIPHTCFQGKGLPSNIFATNFRDKKISGTYGERINFKVGYKLCFDGTSRTDYSFPIKEEESVIEPPLSEEKKIISFNVEAFLKVMHHNRVFWPVQSFGKLESFVRASGNTMKSFHHYFNVAEDEMGLATIPEHLVEKLNKLCGSTTFK